MSRATEIVIKGVAHPVVMPPSPVVCLEAYQYVWDAQGAGSPTRGYSAIIGLCIPSLRPPGLPKWDGESQPRIGQIMADHLMSPEIGLTPKRIAAIMTATELHQALIERVPVDQEEVAEAEKNS